MNWKWLKAALATALVLVVMAGVGLLNTWRWYDAWPPYMAQADFPPSLYLGAVVLVVQFVAAGLVLLGSAFGSASFGGRRVRLGISVLLVVHVVTWVKLVVLGHSAMPLSAHAVRLLVGAWLVLLLNRLAPNNSSKPTPLRGAA